MEGRGWYLLMVVGFIASVLVIPALTKNPMLHKSRSKRADPSASCLPYQALLDSLGPDWADPDPRYNPGGIYQNKYVGLVKISWATRNDDIPSDGRCPRFLECFDDRYKIVGCDCKVWKTLIPGPDGYTLVGLWVWVIVPVPEYLTYYNPWDQPTTPLSDDYIYKILEYLKDGCDPVDEEEYIPGTLSILEFDFCSTGEARCSPIGSRCHRLFGNYQCYCQDGYEDMYDYPTEDDWTSRRGTYCRKRGAPDSETEDSEDSEEFEFLEDMDFWVYILIALAILVVILLLCCCCCYHNPACSGRVQSATRRIRKIRILQQSPVAPAPCHVPAPCHAPPPSCQLNPGRLQVQVQEPYEELEVVRKRPVEVYGPTPSDGHSAFVAGSGFESKAYIAGGNPNPSLPALPWSGGTNASALVQQPTYVAQPQLLGAQPQLLGAQPQLVAAQSAYVSQQENSVYAGQSVVLLQ